MAEPTVFEMEIEGVVHPVEDRTARQTVEKLATYSTTEQDTGKVWIDGKKIYRRVFKGETTTYSETVAGRRLFNMSFSIPDAGEIVLMDSKARLFNATTPTGIELTGTGVFCGQNMTINAAITNFITIVTAPQLVVYSQPSLAFTRVTYTCVVEYTKSE